MSSAPRILTLDYQQRQVRAPGINWVIWFFAIQMFCQVALIFPGLGAVRMIVRVAAFGASLIYGMLLLPRFRQHPAIWPVIGVAAILGLSIVHPLTNNLTVGVAQALLYASIMAPLWWVAGLRIEVTGFRLLILLLWAFHAASALVGVIQMMIPGALTPDVSSVVSGQGDWYVEDMKITLANGARVFRPMGLSDYPGGAASSGFCVIVIGLGLWMGEKKTWLKVAFLSAFPVALFCIYLSQVRSTLVMTGLCALAFMVTMGIRGEFKRMAQVATTLIAVVVLSFAWAVAVGGETVTKRLSSLIDDKPSEVYYSNRGRFLDQTVNELLPKYPLGAGLGRWGMMYYYFANKSDVDRGEIWAEIQWTGWLLDGGVPLILLYSTAMGMAIWISGRIALDPHRPMLAMLGAMLLAYNFGSLAMTFNYPLFIGQGGLEFWTLNACLFAASNAPRWVIEPVRITSHPGKGSMPVVSRLWMSRGVRT